MSPSRARAHVTFASVAAPLLAILTAALVWLAVSTGALSSDRKDAADARAGTVSPAPIVAPLVPDAETGLALPKKLGSLRFAVIGDVGRGDDAQYRDGGGDGALARTVRFFVCADARRQHVRCWHARRLRRAVRAALSAPCWTKA